MWILEVDHLSKSFPQGFLNKHILILKDLSFKIRRGVCTGFIGLNGSGKTTTLKCLIGFLIPDSGQIRWSNGSNLEKSATNLDFREQLGFLPERPYYYEFLTAQEFLHLHWQLAKPPQSVSFDKACQSVLQRVQLSNIAHKKIRHYSKGMLQRLGLAQALLTDPQILILDEPMSGLDPDGRHLVKKILQEEKLKNKTIFFSSHLLSDMQELCDDLLVLQQGELLFSGPLKSFSNQGLETLEEAFVRHSKDRR